MKTNSPIKILLVDDLPENLFALELIFSNKNYKCVKANSGNKALKILLREQDFAIILMDVQMPKMDGFETVELIREIETLKHLPIIFLTANMDNSTHVFKGYQVGAIDYMIKPLIPEILIAKVAVFVELYLKTHELLFQNDEKEKRAAEVSVANIELAFQNDEKEKRAAELEIANIELAFQNDEKEKRAAELEIANIELAFQNDEKEKRAAELGVANKELAFQNDEKEKRAAELGVANKELVFQNDEKEKRAAELEIANKELAFQNGEKEKRAAELEIANIELAFQNDEKEKRAAELGVANKELVFQNDEKEKRAAELGVANIELAFQNDEKEKLAEELRIANKELLSFTYISSHDMQEPLRKIQSFISIILREENETLSDKGKNYFQRIQSSAERMQKLIIDLLAYSRINETDRKFEKTELSIIIDDVKAELKDAIEDKNATIEAVEFCSANIIPFQFRQLIYNLISNALKFSRADIPSLITIRSIIVKGSELNVEKLSPEKNYCHITVKDNGIGFEPHFSELIFGVFQKLHSKDVYMGTGIGLAIVKKIVENHNGIVTATGELNKGATFDIYIPAN